MSEANSLPFRTTVVRTIFGFGLCAAFGGLGACGTEKSNDGAEASRASQASSDSNETSINGQSGTEYENPGGVDRPACPCGGTLANPLRATVLEVVGHIEGADFRPVRLGTVRLRVEELLGSTTGLEIGSEITSAWFGELPCYYGCASIAAGDEVLAFYRFPEPCIDTTGDDCPNGSTLAGSIALTPWADTVVLAQLANGDLTLPVEDVSLVESPECDAQLGNVHNRLSPEDESAPACFELASGAP